MSSQTHSQVSLYKKSLSQTLNSEIEQRAPYNKSLVSYKRWSDSLRPPFRGMAHQVLKKSLEWWYEKPISLHCLPIEEQVENVRKTYGTESDRGKDQGGYKWNGEGDWHH